MTEKGGLDEKIRLKIGGGGGWWDLGGGALKKNWLERGGQPKKK